MGQSSPFFVGCEQTSNETNYNTKPIDHENNAGGEAVCRGLSNTNKGNELENSPKTRLLNEKTGEIIEITPELKHKFRLAKMQARIHAWSCAVKLFGGLDGGKRYRSVMITMTYREGEYWQPNHINLFMDGLKRVLGDKFVAYAWVSEMQKRLVPHYHVFLVVKRGTWIPTPDKPHGQRGHVLWPHGSTKTETARSPFYLMKYTGKEYQKEGFYRGMRIFAVWIAKDMLSKIERFKFRMSSLPSWLRKEVKPFLGVDGYAHPKPSPGGGWLFMGQLLRSDWQYQEFRDGQWVNASTSMANLQYDDMTDGERHIIDYREMVDFAKGLAGAR